MGSGRKGGTKRGHLRSYLVRNRKWGQILILDFRKPSNQPRQEWLSPLISLLGLNLLALFLDYSHLLWINELRDGSHEVGILFLYSFGQVIHVYRTKLQRNNRFLYPFIIRVTGICQSFPLYSPLEQMKSQISSKVYFSPTSVPGLRFLLIPE